MDLTSPPPRSFEEKVSRVRLWTLPVTVLVPTLTWSLIQRGLGVSLDVNRNVTGLLIYGLSFAWWLVNVAPRPLSVRAAMGRPPNLAGWWVVLVALFGMLCLKFTLRLVPDSAQIVAAFRSGGTYSYTAAKAAPELILVFKSVLLPAITEELIFRGTLFRKWRVRWGVSLAVLLTSAIFAAWHKDMLGAFLGALTYALVYTRTRSLWPAVFMHASNNALLVGLDVHSYLRDAPKLIYLDRPWEYGVFALVLLLGIAAWVHFVIKSWPTLGVPLPPDSLQTAPVEAPASSPELVRLGN